MPSKGANVKPWPTVHPAAMPAEAPRPSPPSSLLPISAGLGNVIFFLLFLALQKAPNGIPRTSNEAQEIEALAISNAPGIIDIP